MDSVASEVQTGASQQTEIPRIQSLKSSIHFSTLTCPEWYVLKSPFTQTPDQIKVSHAVTWTFFLIGRNFLENRCTEFCFFFRSKLNLLKSTFLAVVSPGEAGKISKIDTELENYSRFSSISTLFKTFFSFSFTTQRACLSSPRKRHEVSRRF